MSSEQIFKGFLGLPLIVVATAAKASLLVNVLYGFEVLFIIDSSCFWMRDKEGVMSISGWVGLRLEEGIKVPEGTLNVPVSLHLFKSHL